MSLPILAFICLNGNMNYQYGNNETGSIYNPEDKKDRALDLPSGQKIVFTVIVTKISTGSLNDDQFNIRDLREDELYHIITHIKPDEMKENQLPQELSAKL